MYTMYARSMKGSLTAFTAVSGFPTAAAEHQTADAAKAVDADTRWHGEVGCGCTQN
eukprot:CAMPEP_0183498476 /NCGR_PEP_ID=MMETSP0371-20130417/831_1 /TAXON_ID=268820 /ORGANISM="Peridinium aciculiferum, Strain PAER-2" /LENGTH=55 /DNA_ID=CAMNT_0025692013 /DNA_START=33 /DNA_END=199 /DNA_ORIENTATION=-